MTLPHDYIARTIPAGYTAMRRVFTHNPPVGPFAPMRFNGRGSDLPLKVANNTYYYRTTEGQIVCRFHFTDVCVLDLAARSFTINNGGYRTRTTHDRVRAFMRNFEPELMSILYRTRGYSVWLDPSKWRVVASTRHDDGTTTLWFSIGAKYLDFDRAVTLPRDFELHAVTNDVTHYKVTQLTYRKHHSWPRRRNRGVYKSRERAEVKAQQVYLAEGHRVKIIAVTPLGDNMVAILDD